MSALVPQSTVDTLVFVTEFVTLKQSIDALRGLRYKLRMMDIPVSFHHIFTGTIYQWYIIYPNHSQY